MRDCGLYKVVQVWYKVFKGLKCVTGHPWRRLGISSMGAEHWVFVVKA